MAKPYRFLYILIIVILLLSAILMYLLKKPVPISDFKQVFDYKNEYFDDPVTKYYKSETFDKRAVKFLNNDFNESYIINTVLNKFGESGDIFICGGFLRDISLGITPRDFDFKISLTNKADIVKVFEEHNIEYIRITEVDKKKTNVVFGEITELTQFQTMTKPAVRNAENDVNAMYYDYKRKVIVDLTGTGFLNNLNLKFRIIQPSFDAWANLDFHGHLETRAPLRIFKMFRKGYKLQEEGEKTLTNLRSWFRQKIDFYKNTLINYPPGNIWPILAWSFFLIRGDKINLTSFVIIKRGKDEIYLGEILYEIYKFDKVLHKEIIENLIIYDPTLEKYRYF
jgi:hypothetical protein